MAHRFLDNILFGLAFGMGFFVAQKVLAALIGVIS